MKIINKQEFLKLPEDSLYSEYKPCIISGLFIKGGTWDFGDSPSDYIELNLIENIDCESSEEYNDILLYRKEFKIDYEGGGRNGFFDNEQQYVLYDKEDIQSLINTLQGLLK